MSIQLPEDVKPINPNPESDGITLPFTAPVFWWSNGDKKMSQVGGVQFYGGWNGNDEDIESAVAEFGALPDGFTVETRQGNDGEYVTYSRRSLTIVPIKARKRWVDGRSHSQTLVIVGEKTNEGFKEWGTAVLSAKGYSTQRLTDAIRSWHNHTRQVRDDFAPGVPSWYFWQSVGTFGEYKEEKVGKSVQNAITPVSVYLPEMNEALLKKLYVGADLARRIGELEQQAYEWATDKKWLKNETSEDAPIAQNQPVEWNDEPPAEEDQVPW